MNRHRHVSVITFVLVFVAGSLACDGPAWSAGEPSSATGEWARLTTTAREADESKDYALALSSYREALRLAERLEWDHGRTSALESIARVYVLLGKKIDGLPYLEEAWRLRLANGTHRDERARSTQRTLRHLYRKLGAWEKLEPFAREDLREKEDRRARHLAAVIARGGVLTALDVDAIDVITALQWIAVVVERARPGDPEAEALYRRSVELARMTELKALYSVESHYSKAAFYYSRHGRHDQAIELLKWAVVRHERESYRDLDKLAAYRQRLASGYGELGRYELAEAELREALALEEEHFGSGHRRIVRTLRSLGDLLASQKRYEEAIDSIRRAVGIIESAWGVDAAAELRQSLRALERRAAGDSDAPLGALVHKFKGKPRPEPAPWRDRIERAEKNLAATEAEHGPESLAVAAALATLGSVYSSVEYHEAAFEVLERRLRILCSKAGIADWRVASLAHLLASRHSYYRRDERVEAYRHLRIDSLQAAGIYNPVLADAYRDLGDVQLRRGDLSAAAESLQIAAEIWLDLEGSDAPETLENRYRWALFLLEAGNHEQAEEILLELVDRLQRHPSQSSWVHKQLVSATNTLARLFRETGRQEEAERLLRERNGA